MMNQSRIANSYKFKDDNEMFKVQHSEKGLPTKILESFKSYADHPRVRLINDWMLAISSNSMLIWKYSSPKNAISACKEYFLPNSDLSYCPNQGTIIFDQAYNKPLSCIIVGHDGVVRFWPELSLPHEYIDQKIPNICNDSCVMVDKMTDDVLVFLFKSMKIIIADMKDYADAGISFKQFTQPVGFISRCLSSLFVGSSGQRSSFVNIKTNRQHKEDLLELLVLVDNNIDSLALDILHNGRYTKAALSRETMRKAIAKAVQDKFSLDPEYLNLTLSNFDLCRNIFYTIIEITAPTDGAKANFLVTYNRNLDVVDSVAHIDNDFEGDIEIVVIEDDSQKSDHPCLLAAIKDNYKIMIVEVLTGSIKASYCLGSSGNVNSKQHIIGWTCPKLPYDTNTIITAVTASKQIVFIKQQINPFVTDTITRLQTETNLSNASFGEMNTRSIGHRGDIETTFNTSFALKMHPMALSTPKSKLDHMGDRFADDSIVNKSTNELNTSVNLHGTFDHMATDNSVAGEFRKCVMLFWLGYKTQASRLMTSIIDASLVDPEVSIPNLTLQIAREIIDELPTKDPRWVKLKDQSNRNKFCFSNKSLILVQQLAAKRDALHNLVLMLKENHFDMFGSMGNVAPMAAHKILMVQGGKSEYQLFGDCQVNWSLGNCVGLGAEFLEFVRVLHEIMGSQHCPEIDAILSRSCQDVLAVQKKLSPIDIISQQVSLVAAFVNDCCDYLNEKRDCLSDLNSFDGNLGDEIVSVKRVCQLVARIVSAGLRASLASRKKFEDGFLLAHFSCAYSSASVSAPCWITEQRPIGVADAIVDMVINLVEFSRGLDNHQVLESVFDIVGTYLEAFQHRIEWMESFSRNDSELDRLAQAFKESRYQLIEKLVEDGKFLEKGLDLADRFQDFHWITALCEVLDDQAQPVGESRLDAYLQRYCESGLSEFVLDWYQDKLKEGGQQGKLLAKIQRILEKIEKLEGGGGANASTRTETSTNSVVIGRFLERSEVQATRWLHEIEMDEFGQAARTLARLGETEHGSLGRKRNLLSLAKLSHLAGGGRETDPLVRTACRQLTLIKFQEDVPAAVIESELGYSSEIYNQPSIAVPQLVKLLLASARRGDQVVMVDHRQMVRALQLLDFSTAPTAPPMVNEAEFAELRRTIWSQAIAADSWTHTSPDEVSSTTLATVMKTAAELGMDLDKLLPPDVDALFEDGQEQLAAIAGNPELVFVIKRAFETLIRELDCPMGLDRDTNGHMEVVN